MKNWDQTSLTTHPPASALLFTGCLQFLCQCHQSLPRTLCFAILIYEEDKLQLTPLLDSYRCLSIIF